jgi:AcrR family transcriptional regulator
MARTNAKEPLINAARDLFSEKGFDGTGVDEIAESIGIKGPTIYKYFKNKEDLLKAVQNSVSQMLREVHLMLLCTFFFVMIVH